MQEIDGLLLNELVEIIYQRIEEKLKKQLNSSNIEFSYDGIVKNPVSDPNDNTVTLSADIELSFCTVRDVPNHTEKTLYDGDKVRIFYNKSNIGNSYIGVKF